jgi:hypothetical protein
MNRAQQSIALLLIITSSGFWLVNSTPVVEVHAQASKPTVKLKQPLLFGLDDLKDPGRLAAQIRNHPDPVSSYLWERFSPETKRMLERYPGSGAPASELNAALVQELNRVLQGPSIYDPKRFAGMSLRPETKRLMERHAPGGRSVRLNRALLEDAYAGIITGLGGIVFEDDEEQEAQQTQDQDQQAQQTQDEQQQTAAQQTQAQGEQQELAQAAASATAGAAGRAEAVGGTAGLGALGGGVVGAVVCGLEGAVVGALVGFVVYGSVTNLAMGGPSSRIKALPVSVLD